jgi:hypothetical protein
MSDPLNIHNEMRALDLKQRDWFDRLEPELQRKFSPFLMLRWGSSVQGSSELQEYYLLSTNQRLNRHFFSISAARHKKLLWLMATAVSPDLGAQRHAWIAQRREKHDNDKLRLIRQMWPHLREAEAELMAAINTLPELKAHAELHGQPD